MDQSELTKHIKSWGVELGFQQVGITTTELMEDEAHFLNLDLRNSKKNNQLLGKINELKKNRELVIFFSDSFDLFLLNKILKKISIKFNYYCIIVNLRNKNLLKIKYMTLLNKKFKSQNRNIKILKINEKK